MKKWFGEMLSSMYVCSARVCGGLIAILIFLTASCCFLQYAKPRYEEFYSKKFVIIEPENLNKTEKNYVNKLVLKNKIISVDAIYGKTLSYYDSLISVLTIFITITTALLGILAFTSWFSLKGKVKNDVQEIKHKLKEDISHGIQEVVNSEFYKTWLTTEVFGKYITENRDKLFPDMSSINIDNIVDDITEKVIQKSMEDKKKINLPQGMEEEL